MVPNFASSLVSRARAGRTLKGIEKRAKVNAKISEFFKLCPLESCQKKGGRGVQPRYLMPLKSDLPVQLPFLSSRLREAIWIPFLKEIKPVPCATEVD
jgi:hypothetical protein